jgi:actin-like ATPase involved in cell morphogenesis
MYALGIDLGTTFTAAAVWRDGRAEIAALGSRAAAIPSVVLLRQDETFLTGETANRRALSEPDRVAREFKRRLGDTTPILLGGVPYSAEALMARLLRSVITEVSTREGGEPALICVCHPANWGPYKTDLLRQAVRIADLEQPVTLVTEPEAAAVFYARQQRIDPGSVVAVYDLGGGTFDAAVLRKTQTGFEILGQPEGIERLGGIDFDAAVFSHVARVLGGKLAELDEDSPAAIAAVARLKEECTEAKEALSTDTDVTIPVLLPNVSTEVRLTRAELEAMVRPALSDSIEALKRAIRSAGVTPEDLDTVLLVGGSSRMPIVSQLVAAELGRPVAADAHPKHAVALGAAFVASAAPAAAAGATTGPPSRPTPAVRRDSFDDRGRRDAAGRPARPGPPSGPVPAVGPLPPVGPASGPVPAIGPLAGTGRPNLDRPGPDRPGLNRPGPDRPGARPGLDRPGDRREPAAGPGRPGPVDRLDAPGRRTGADSGLPPGPRMSPPGARQTGAPPPGARPAAGPPPGAARPPGAGTPPGRLPPPGRADDRGRRPADDYFPLDPATRSPRPAPADATEVFARVPAGGPPTFQPPRPSRSDGRGGGGRGGATRRMLPVVIAFLLAAAVAAVAGILYAKHDRSSPGQNNAANNRPASTDAARTNNTPSSKPSPTVPSDEQCTDQIKASTRWVCLTKATFDGNQIVIEYQANFAGGTPHAAGGFHLHIYGGGETLPDESTMGSQSPTPGRWYVEDENPSIRKASSNDFKKAIGADATRVCARIANSQHALVKDADGGFHTGNCIPIQRI